MKDLEKMIWASVFANKAVENIELELRRSGEWNFRPFSCAEIADLVVEKFRELDQDSDAHYLKIYQEIKHDTKTTKAKNN